MKTNTICLTFNDQAEQAANHYTSIFKDSKIINVVRMGPSGIAAEGKVLLVTFTMNGVNYMVLNGGSSFTFTHGISIMVNCDTQEEIDYVWERLCDGGKEVECGWLVDKFGVSWQVVPSNIGELMTDKDPAKSKRVFDALMTMKKIHLPTLLKARQGE
jgi:predicted 3-demethylubiquinone-9 3-methyltransferase (glyoxalase superfamily)